VTFNTLLRHDIVFQTDSVRDFYNFNPKMHTIVILFTVNSYIFQMLLVHNKGVH
jgi:hypothetical protein